MDIKDIEFKTPEFLINSVGRTQCKTSFLKPGDRVQIINNARNLTRSKLIVNGQPYSIDGNEWVFLNTDIQALSNKGFSLTVPGKDLEMSYYKLQPYIDIVLTDDWSFTVHRYNSPPENKVIPKGERLRIHKSASHNWFTVIYTSASRLDTFDYVLSEAISTGGRASYINKTFSKISKLFDDSIDNSVTVENNTVKKFVW